ncbi:MAG: hypothetical protein WCR21_03205 [Bacteroidota bacterium]
MPVYLHYCGGQLEEISYLVKANNCCSGDDDDATSDCCHNEHFYLHNGSNFSFKVIHVDFTKVFSQVLNLVHIEKGIDFLQEQNLSSFIKKQFPPPKLCQKALINCAFLRI